MDGVNSMGDLQTTVDTFNSVRTNVTEFGHIITACWPLFSSHFSNSRVEFTRQQTNMVAHSLAREATSIGSPIIYL